MATQHGDPVLQPSTRSIDYTHDHIAMLLSAQTNDQGRYALAEKIILDLLKERQDLLEAKEIELKERQDLLEAKEIERKELSMKNDILLAMSTQQLDKIQTLEKRLQAVDAQPEDNNIKKTPAFIHIPDTKANHRHFQYIEIAKYSDLHTSQCYNERVLKPKERAYIVEGLTTVRAEYPVINYKGMRNTIQWFQQELRSNSLHACANILESKKEKMDLYTEWNTYWKRQEGDELTKNAKIQSSTILDEILRKIFSKDNPELALQFHQAATKIPQDLLGVYTYSLVKEYFPQANLDVIVSDIAKVMMFSLQAPRYTTFDTWYHSFMQKIETLDLLYGQITWEQVYLAMVLWALQLMGDKYTILRRQIKMNLPSATKDILNEPKETLDKVMEMISKWETPMLSWQTTKEMKGQTYEAKQVALDIMCKMLGLPLQSIQGADNT